MYQQQKEPSDDNQVNLHKLLEKSVYVPKIFNYSKPSYQDALRKFNFKHKQEYAKKTNRWERFRKTNSKESDTLARSCNQLQNIICSFLSLNIILITYDNI